MYKKILASLSLSFASILSVNAEEEIVGNPNISISAVEEIASDPNLVLWYRFDEGKASTLNDASSNAFHADLFQLIKWVPGKYGIAIEFDGALIRLPKVKEIFAKIDKQITISFWTYDNGTGKKIRQVILWSKNSKNKSVISCELPGVEYGPKLAAKVGGFPYLAKKKIKKESLQGRWIHWALSKNQENGQFRLYQDGEVVLSGDDDKQALNDITTFVIGGQTGRTFMYPGQIDDFRIYSKALSQEEVKAISTAEAK